MLDCYTTTKAINFSINSIAKKCVALNGFLSNNKNCISIFGEALKSKINKVLECHDFVLWP